MHRRVAAALALALACTQAPRRAGAQACAPSVPGGVVVTEGRGGTRGSIAASAQGVVAGWEEVLAIPLENGLSTEDPPTVFRARRLDPLSLAPQGASVEIVARRQSHEHPMSGPVAAMPDGTLVAPYCYCTGGTGESGCHATPVGGGSAPAFRPALTRSGGCGRGRPVVSHAGSTGLLVDVSNEMDATLIYATTRASPGMHRLLQTDAMSAADLDGARALLVAREQSALHALLIDANARVTGRDVVLSASGEEVGAPAVASLGGEALVAFAARRNRAPWSVALVRYRPGSAPVRTALGAGAQSMAPALVPSRRAGCAVVAWVEGSGHGTVARAGTVCNGALDATTAAQLSRPGIEAGDAELATDGAHVYALWQELPPGRGRARVELRAAVLGCN